MKKIKNLLISLTCVGLLFVFGCEPHGHSGNSSASTEETQIAGSPIKISSFGHPNCANAVEDPHVQIKDFVFRKSGMSYKWASSTKLEVWGLQYTQAGALAVAGWYDGKEWKCAKFDWISSSRTTRDWVNVNSHYNGFDPNAFFGSAKHCFFIMSSDGRKRSNIIFD